MDGAPFRLTFASYSPISWPAIAEALDGSSICCKKVQIFEKKGLTLGIATLLVPSANERLFKARAEAALRSAVKKPPRSNAANVVKLPFGLCGCQEQGAAGILDEESEIGGGEGARLECESETLPPNPLPESSLVMAIDEWQTVRSDVDEIGRWLLGGPGVGGHDSGDGAQAQVHQWVGEAAGGGFRRDLGERSRWHGRRRPARASGVEAVLVRRGEDHGGGAG